MIDGMCYHNAMTLLFRMNQLKAYMCSRSLFVILALIAPIRMFGAGWTPTDAGLFVNLQPDDKFLLSVWIDDDGDGVEDAGEEYFVCHYNGYTGGKFSYGTGNFLKLIPQDAGATEPSGVSIWTVDTALTRPAGALGGVSYTMWSSSGYTLQTTGNAWAMLGNLSNNTSDGNLCGRLTESQAPASWE